MRIRFRSAISGALVAFAAATALFNGAPGAIATQGQPVTMEGLSTGKATLVMSQAGVFLGGLNEDQANIKIVLAANGMEIGVNTTANTTVEKVK